MAWMKIGRLIAAINRWLAEQEEDQDRAEQSAGRLAPSYPSHSSHPSRRDGFYGLYTPPGAQDDELAEEDRSPFIPSPFAEEWYRMRELGEHDRAQALSALYTRRPHPGGSHPDPRVPAAFSNRAILAAVARLKGLTIWPVPDSAHASGSRRRARQPAQNPVWLITYPLETNGQRKPPNIAVTQQEEEDLMLWYVSCMLGLIAREPHRLTDPNIPAGVTTLPTDPMTRALIHRYAHALMLVDFDCSQAFGCACSAIDRALNAPPLDHPQPTQTLPAQRANPIISQPTSPPDRGVGSHQRPPKKSNPLGEG